MRNFRTAIAAGVAALTLATANAGQGPNLNLLGSTPQGSWQVREQTSTNQKGERTTTLVRTSLVGTEQRDGEPCLWIETEVLTTTVDKKGKAKQGQPILGKALVKRSAFELDSSNAVRNPMDFAVEVVTQIGDENPIRFSGKSLSKAGDILGVSVTYAWQQVGTESVTVPGGSFQALHLKGSGTSETKVLFKKIKVESQSDMWYSTQVPFGLVKGQGSDVVNGKTESWTMELKEYGRSGAVTKITKTPQELPQIKLPVGK